MVATTTRSETLNGDEEKDARAGRRLGYRRFFSRNKSNSIASGRPRHSSPARSAASASGADAENWHELFPRANPRTAFAMNWNVRVIGAKLATPAPRAAAGADRRLAEAEFRPYIRAGFDCQYSNAIICNNHV
jgi:hypothetical protein